jgi:hypothetical protein
MCTKPILSLTLLIAFVVGHSSAREIPLVYDVENTGADCNMPPLPAFAALPTIEPLPDPFEWSDGSGRSTDFNDWTCRRAEIKAEIEHYEIGPKPDRPDDITASYSGGILTVNVTVNGNTLTLTSPVSLPPGSGPFPAVIGMGGPTGSLPSDIFTSRGIATIAFNYSQVMAHAQVRGREPINKLYPDLTYMGAYSAWAWGVSRLIDGLELVSADLPIDLKHLAVTGCSFAGKMALFAGAFDERIALTIAQESGGGGAAAWRVSQTLTESVETLGNTDHTWFMESMFQFSNAVSKLPHDHHELMAMVAPRALLVLGNPDYVWLAEESGYVSCRAAQQVWKTFGIPERFGFSFVGGHSHCMLPDVQRPEVEAFVDAFLLDDETADTNVATNPYSRVDDARWYWWWGTGTPVFPDRYSVWLEAECGTVGADWDKLTNDQASNGKYVAPKPGMQSLSAAPADSSDAITLPFSVDMAATFFVFARLSCPTAHGDSFWAKIDDEEFVMVNGFASTGWQWMPLSSHLLTAGPHTLTIAYREDGVLLDKISVSLYPYAPKGTGDNGQNCVPPRPR